MLVLSRKPGQWIEIGNGITIVVTRVAAGRVAIGIDAPQEFQIRRSELAEASKPDRQYRRQMRQRLPIDTRARDRHKGRGPAQRT